MPLVRVNMRKGRTAKDKDLIGDGIQAALEEVVGVPRDDWFQLFDEFEPQNFQHTSGYLGMNYSDQLLIIEITFLVGREADLMKRLHAAINKNLVTAGVVASDDIFVMVYEIGAANLSFGGGIAQRAS
jgi:phenylpyruvate tautomerase PptA (4-oxalocrotonate tautomerase family)